MPTGTRPDPATRQARLVFDGDFQGARWTNVMWLFFTGSGEITSADLVDVAEACGTLYNSTFLTHMSTDCRLETVGLTLWSEGEPFSVTVPSDTQGDIATDITPAQVACVVSWNILPSYRGGHPRTYLAGQVLASVQSSTTWTSTHVDAVTLDAIAFHDGVEAIDPPGSGITAIEHGVVSFVRGGAWRTPPVFYRIFGASVDSRIDTQRRRLGPDR